MSVFGNSIKCEDCSGHGSVSGSTCSTCNGKGKVSRGTTFRRNRDDDSQSTMAAMDPLGLLNPLSPLNLALHAGNSSSNDSVQIRNDDPPAAPAAAPPAAPVYSAPDTTPTFSAPDSAPSMPTDL